MAKDSVVIMDEINGETRLFWPTEDLTKRLMGIDEAFSVKASSTEVAAEILGQSIDGHLEASVLRSIEAHVKASRSAEEAA